MPLNLKIARDHPGVLLAARAAAQGRTPGEEEYASHTQSAANFLGQHEQEFNVTFAALDNATIERVSEIYERQVTSEGMDAYDAAVDLVGAVRDLLGLDDA